ncbi:MAG: hypothetical protein H6560_13325 [Lewinellaceae bacterium]|nr:hypothetical protein [Lewinellaceae bacterium]
MHNLKRAITFASALKESEGKDRLGCVKQCAYVAEKAGEKRLKILPEVKKSVSLPSLCG